MLTANPDQAGQQNTGKFMDVDAITVYNATGGNPIGRPNNVS